MLRSLVSNKNAIFNTFRSKFILPERFKGTFMEKWGTYWKNLYLDYKSMVVDLKTDMQERPKNAMVLLSLIGISIQLARNNPDEVDFRDSLLNYKNQILLVGENCLNTKASEHFKSLEDFCNRGTLRRLNLGIGSLLWIDDYNKECDLYKTKCSYVKPGFTSIPFRIVDVGIGGRWWNMFIKFQNFDVNFK